MDDVKEQTDHPHGSAGKQPRRLAANDLRDEILHVIEEHGREHNRPPTIREICAAVRVESTSHVAYHVSILKRAGLVNHAPGSRGLTSTRTAGLPVLGTI